MKNNKIQITMKSVNRIFNFSFFTFHLFTFGAWFEGILL